MVGLNRVGNWRVITLERITRRDNMALCVCVCVCDEKREREREKGKGKREEGEDCLFYRAQHAHEISNLFFFF